MAKTGCTGARQLLRAVALCALLALPASGPVHGQSQDAPALWDPQGIELSRPELEALLARLEEASRSSGYSDATRAHARAEAELVRERLEHGDFDVGDQIHLYVEGEPALQDTFTVNGSREVVLPAIGSVDMSGVLRAEVAEHFAQELARYIREPIVRAESLLRISVIGSVGAPGFYTVQSTALLSDVLMQVGGPTAGSDLDRLRIERDGEPIWEGQALQRALREGRTLDQLSLQAGDQILLPAERQTLSTLRTLLYIVPGLISIIALIAS
ncbi:MAG: polysaccharide biosynthesis/export family protein [Longimicrobiales bacterium]